MASPRTMFSGTIELGLLNVPVTVAKAIGDEKGVESLLTEVCDHGDAEGVVRIDRTHRCHKCDGPPLHKIHAVEVDEGVFRKISEHEWTTIEDAGKGLTVEDVQPLAKLPMMFAFGTYYVRHNDKAKVSPKAYATLVDQLARGRRGLVCKWNQKLCVIYAESGVLVLRQIPFVTEVRPASTKEREHWKVNVAPEDAERMGTLLEALSNPKGFRYNEHENERLRLRREAVERVLEGATPVPSPEPEEDAVDPFEQIELAIAQARDKVEA